MTGDRCPYSIFDPADLLQFRNVDDRRIVGRVYVDETDVNRELVAQGFAWVYRKYSNDAELLRLEAKAKQKGLGLWAEPNPIPPWEWRRGRRIP